MELVGDSLGLAHRILPGGGHAAAAGRNHEIFGNIFTAKRAKQPAAEVEVEEEVIAAIATALRIYRGALHDKESEVLTIMSIKRAYSPWNSKIHGLTQMPDRK